MGMVTGEEERKGQELQREGRENEKWGRWVVANNLFHLRTNDLVID